MIEYIDRHEAIHAIKEHCEDTIKSLSPGFPIELQNAYIMAHQHCMTVLSLLPASVEERKQKEQKHGRLIDADALKRNIKANLPVAVQDLCLIFCNIVDMQKTVIESEE